MREIISFLQVTPIPTIFVVSGIFFLLVSLNIIGFGQINVESNRWKSGIIGIGLLLCGVILQVAAISPSPLATPSPTAISASFSPITLTPTRQVTRTSEIIETPQKSLVEIAALNIISEVQADGTIKNTANLAVEDLGYGELELLAPSTINLDESGIVRLTITPDSALEGLLPVSVDLASANAPSYGIAINNQIQIYPIMIAELEGVNFEINPSGPQKKVVTSKSQVVWTWSIAPEASGKQSLVVVISIPVLVNQKNDEISAELKNIPIQVLVEVTATPIPLPTVTPTETPNPTPTKTTSQRVADNLANNSALLIGTILTFILGIPTAWISIATYRRQVKKTEEQEWQLVVDEINSLTTEGVQNRVKNIDDIKILRAWLKEERKNKNRKGAIEAIDSRIEILREK